MGAKTMQRRLLIGMGLALVILGIALWLLLRFQGEPGRGAAKEGDISAPTAVDNEPESTEKAAEVVAAPVAETETAAEPVEEMVEEPPLLRGRVIGEGSGVPRASVLFFAVREVERLLERLERAGIQAGGGFPDVPKLVGLLREELNRFRTVAIRATTDDAGEFELRDVDAGGYLVLTLADGWLFRYGDVVSLEPGRTEELVVELERGASIEGRVVDPSGFGATGVSVVAEYRPPGMPGVGRIVRRVLRLVNGEFLKGPFEARTDVDGRFTISSLPPGVYDLAAVATSGVEARLASVESGTADAVIVLGRGARIVGSFTDDDGFPVSSLNVKLERQDDVVELPLLMSSFSGVANTVNRFLGSGPQRAVSQADGSFRFSPLGAGRYRLSVEDRGFLPLSREVEVEWGEDHSLGLVRVSRGEAIRGWVRSQDGVPLSGATVLAAPAKANFMTMGPAINDVLTGRVQVLSGQDGAFLLEGLKPGQFRLTVTHPNYAPGVVESIAAGDEPVEVELRPGATVSGRVLDAQSGQPVAGARVRVGGVRSRADEEGVFILEGVAAGREAAMNPFGGQFGGGWRRNREGEEAAPANQVSLRVRAKGYLRENFELDLDSLPEEVELEIERASEVAGVVYDPDGNPAPGALVRLAPWMPEEVGSLGFFDPSLIFLAVGVSDLEGKFRFRDFHVADGDRYRILADHPSWARGTSPDFSLGEKAEDEEIEVHLLAGGTVKGTVSDGSQALGGAIVRLGKPRKRDPRGAFIFNMLGLPKGGKVAHTNSRGEFHYDQLLPGDYTVSVEVAGFTDSREETFSLAAGEAREFAFEMDPGGAVAGVVTDDLGNAVPGVRVRLLRENLGGDEESSRRALQFQKRLGGAYKRTTTGEDGAFQFVGLPQGRYTLVAGKDGYSRAEREGVSPGAVSVQLALIPAAALEGAVADRGSGLPVTSFRVEVRKKDAEDGFPFGGGREHSDPDGLFRRENLEPGTYRVEVGAVGYVPARAELVLEPGVVKKHTFTLSAAGRILGRVVDAETRRPVRGATVAIAVKRSPQVAQGAEGERDARRDTGKDRTPTDEDGEAMRDYFTQFSRGESVVSGNDGSFLLESVPESPQTVVATHPDYVQAFREGVEVALGEEVNLEFALSRGLSVSGKVVDSRGTPVPGRFLFLRGNAEANRRVRKTTTTNATGGFRISGLAPGAYRLISPTRGAEERAVLEVELSDHDVTRLELVVPAD